MDYQWANQPGWYGSQPYGDYYQYPQGQYVHQVSTTTPPPPPPPPEKPPLPKDPPPPPGTKESEPEVQPEPTTQTLSYSAWFELQAPQQSYGYCATQIQPIRFNINQPSKPAPPPPPPSTPPFTSPAQVYAAEQSGMDAAARWNAANSCYFSTNTPVSCHASPQTVRVTQPAQPWFNNTQPVSAKGPRFPFKQAVRPTFNAPSQAKAETVSTPPNSQWPPDLKDYVQRAFSSVQKPEEKDQMERILKQKLEYIFKNKIQINWKLESLPVVPSQTLTVRGCNNSPAQNSVTVVRPSLVPLTTPVRPLISPNVFQRPAYSPYNASPSVTAAMISQQTAIKSLHEQPNRNQLRKRRTDAHSNSSRSRSRSRSQSRSRTLSSDSSYSSSSSVGRRRSDQRSPVHPNRRSVSRSRDTNNRGRQRIISRLDSRTSEPILRGGRGGKREKRGGRGGATAVQGESFEKPRGGRGAKAVGRRGGRRGGAPWTLDNDVDGGTRLTQRANRFKDHLGDIPSTLTGSGAIARTTSQLMMAYAEDGNDLVDEFESFKIVGTMQELEKPYLRLTRAPESHEVRPTVVLKRSLDHIKKKNQTKLDYHWLCEQFKSIRQDLTVQCIEDEFTATVYETHADFALEAGDYEEFHQCQSQLLRLHKEGYGMTRRLEFTAYRILYYIFTLDFLGISSTMATLRPIHKDEPHVKFALNLRAAWCVNNFTRFFRLIASKKLGSEDAAEVPGKCLCVVNWFITRERKESAKTIFKVFRPTISLSFVADNLGFSDTDACEKFLIDECGLTEEVLRPTDKLDCKAVWSAFCQALSS